MDNNNFLLVWAELRWFLAVSSFPSALIAISHHLDGKFQNLTAKCLHVFVFNRGMAKKIEIKAEFLQIIKKNQGEKDLISLIYLIQHFPQAVIVVSHHLEGNYKISLSNVYKYFFSTGADVNGNKGRFQYIDIQKPIGASYSIFHIPYFRTYSDFVSCDIWYR